MWWHVPLGGLVWGTGWSIIDPPWYVDAAAGGAIGFAVARPGRTRGAIHGILGRTGATVAPSLGKAARFGGQALAAVGIPVLAGYGVSYAISGREGVNQFSHHLENVTNVGYWTGEWWDTVTLKSMR